MPMIPELAMTMLACARIGAIHSIVFAGFSSESLRGRIEDCSSKWVFTADEGKRGGKTIELKKTVDAVSCVRNAFLQSTTNFSISHSTLMNPSSMRFLFVSGRGPVPEREEGLRLQENW